MNELRKYSRIIIFALCVILTMVYIFSNSLKSQEKSNDTSTKITEQIKPIIDPEDKIPHKELNHKVRKTAHCIEFGVLGIFLALLFDGIKKCFNKTDVFAPLMLALSTAVADEYIQTFNDRGSQVEDVLIDFGGAIVGLFLVFIFSMVLYKRSKT